MAGAVARGDVVVSVGGDGMLCSLAGEVARLGGTLGIVPAGRGNDFARMLGLPDDPLAQADVLLAGATRRVDLVSWAVGGDSVAHLVVGKHFFVPLGHEAPLALGTHQHPVDGFLALPTAPGLGVEINEDAIAKYAA